ncbi:MAG: hypothetical protein JWN83_1288 [Chitinophagaceae bacterium]|nr:hypothetical protein [Chitinophagaceae bacterium]
MRKRIIIKFLFVTALAFTSLFCYSQTPTDSLPGDPGGLYVYTIQNLAFGAFYHGNTGGTIIVANDGSRSVTGDLVALNLGITYFNAIFEIEAPPGTIVSILNGPDATLTGSNGGSMSLNIGSSSPAAPFSTTLSPPSRTQVNIGGTLTIGNNAASPPGSYTGTFYITFNHE